MEAKDRVIWLKGAISYESIANATESLVRLDSENNLPIRLFINSRGGLLGAADNLRELIQHDIISPVITIGCGDVRSAASALFACGAVRLIFSQTKIMYHFPFFLFERGEERNSGELLGMAFDLGRVEKIYFECCTQRMPTHLRPCQLDKEDLKKRIKKIKDKKYEINAIIARDEGFVDGVITGVASIPRFERKLIKRLEELKKVGKKD